MKGKNGHRPSGTIAEGDSTMTIAVLADLHLPDSTLTVKEQVFDWALAEAKKRGARLLVGTGDLTGLGTVRAAQRIRRKLEETWIPFLLTPGNAELRTPAETVPVQELLATPTAAGVVMLLDSSNGRLDPGIRKELCKLLDTPNRNLLAVTHVPPKGMHEKDRELLRQAVKRRVFGKIIAGHRHRDLSEGSIEVVRGLDPDKAAGGAPALALFTLNEEGNWLREDVVCPMADPRLWPPHERSEWLTELGFSGMERPLETLLTAMEQHVAVFEFPWRSTVGIPTGPLREVVELWRAAGGRTLSLHLPEIGWDSGEVTGIAELEQGVATAQALGCDAVTMPAPRVPVGLMEHPEILQQLLEATARVLAPAAAAQMTIGVENQHMRPGEQVDDDRGFGYTPAECREWIDHLRTTLGTPRVGLLLDLGHVRNNAPLSSRFTLSDWYAELGNEIVGFHLHQVRQQPDGSFVDHVPFEELFGELISLSSLFMAWRSGMVNHAPMYLELRNGAGPACRELLKRQLEGGN